VELLIADVVCHILNDKHNDRPDKKGQEITIITLKITKILTTSAILIKVTYSHASQKYQSFLCFECSFQNEISPLLLCIFSPQQKILLWAIVKFPGF
jgi:hypothetical protein